jgi:hypothetical protein
VYGTQTTGAENDIEQATQLARNMVTRWGMSDALGMVQLAPRENAYLGGGALGGTLPLRRGDRAAHRRRGAAHRRRVPSPGEGAPRLVPGAARRARARAARARDARPARDPRGHGLSHSP